MRIRAIALSIVLPLSLATSSCDPVTATAVPILVITALWSVDNEPTRSFSFTALQGDGSRQGTFTGEDDNGGAISLLTGSWEKGEVRFTVAHPSGPRLYVAKFTEDRPLALTFQGPEETITLRRPAF
jgi:hypothetical protein